MFRYLVVHLREFRLERCGWRPEQLVALVGEERSAMRVFAASAPALARGLSPGMTVSSARALLPELELERADLEAEQRDLEALCCQMERHSPHVGPLPPQGLLLELGAGSAEQERRQMEAVAARLAELGHRCSLALADDPATASALARHGEGLQRVPSGGEARALEALPVEALELGEEELALLAGLGVRTVGAFAALPAAALVGRLGSGARDAHARARGEGPRPPVPIWSPAGLPVVALALPEPVEGVEGLRFALHGLLRDLALRLCARGLASTRLRLELELDEGRRQELGLRAGAPTREPDRLLAMLLPRLERLELPAPVLGLRLEVLEAAPFIGGQRGLFDPRGHQEELLAVISRLQDALPEGAVCRPRRVEQHRPEEAWVGLAPERPPAPATRALALHLREDPAWEWRGRPSPSPPLRPALLLPAPRAVDLRLVEGEPRAVYLEQRWLSVEACWGPELLEGEWWRPDGGHRRSCWRLQLEDGRQLWVYEEDGSWALHGLWD